MIESSRGSKAILWMFRNGFSVDRRVCPELGTTALDDLRILTPTVESLEDKRDSLGVDDWDMMRRNLMFNEYDDIEYTDLFQQKPLTLEWRVEENRDLIVHYYLHAVRECMEIQTIFIWMLGASEISRMGRRSPLRSLPKEIFRALLPVLARSYAYLPTL